MVIGVALLVLAVGGVPAGAADLTGLFSSYTSAGRDVYIFKTTPCQDLTTQTTFCQSRGLRWWKAKSAADAQLLITNAYNLDETHTWIQVYGATTRLSPGRVDGYPVTVDGENGTMASNGGWTAFRKWGDSFCNPETSQYGELANRSCCWDTGHPYDWFVCEPAQDVPTLPAPWLPLLALMLVGLGWLRVRRPRRV
jgi:hypothetical protein